MTQRWRWWERGRKRRRESIRERVEGKAELKIVACT